MASTFSSFWPLKTVVGRGKGEPMEFDKLAILCPSEIVSLEPFPLGEVEAGGVARHMEDAIEDMVVSLAAIEASWAAGEFERLKRSLADAVELSERTGLPDVAHVARTAQGLIGGFDDVALAAVIARLVRVGETSLAALLDISYRQS